MPTQNIDRTYDGQSQDISATVLKPILRGWSHVVAAVVALVAEEDLPCTGGEGKELIFDTGLWLAVSAPTREGRWASLAFTASLLVQFTVSGVYHTSTWKPTPRIWLRRADHAAIFLLIAGTYTPICLLALSGPLGRKLLIMIWTSAGVGFLQSLFFVGLPKKVSALLYLAMGWMAARYSKDIVARTGLKWALLVLGGGVLYSIGAAAYAMKWPNPYPKTFGYHEIFHLFVIFASAVHFVAVAKLVLSSDDGLHFA